MKALRLPAPHLRSLIGFASGFHATLPVRGSPQRSRAAGGARPGQDPCSAGGPVPASPHADGYGISQVPWRSFPCLCPAPRPRPNRRPLAISRSRRCCPRPVNNEGFSVNVSQGLPLGFSTCCLRFKSSVARPRQGSLPAGWPLPQGSRTPWIATKGFRSSTRSSSFSGRCPDAMTVTFANWPRLSIRCLFYLVLLPVLCSERERPFFVPSPALSLPERAEGVKGPKRERRLAACRLSGACVSQRRDA